MTRTIAYLTPWQFIAAIILGLILACGLALITVPHPVEVPGVVITPVPTPAPVYITPESTPSPQTAQEVHTDEVNTTRILLTEFVKAQSVYLYLIIAGILVMVILIGEISGNGTAKILGAMTIIVLISIGILSWYWLSAAVLIFFIPDIIREQQY